ncbi:MAG: DUF885 domain-containing protein [Actinomycetales bacterium]|nr:MAG: DUF885 domain-containing protein [Actinomycetales bacterium]
MSAISSQTRTPTAIDHLADDFLAREVALSPIEATYLGIAGYDEQLDDLSPAGYAAHSALRRDVLAQLERLDVVDDTDRVTVAALRDRLGLAEQMYAMGLDEMSLNVIASPLQGVREIFDLMPQDSGAAWSTVAARMEQVPRAMAGYAESLVAAKAAGNVAPRRQVEACIAQCEALTAADGYFATLAAGARCDDGPLETGVHDRLRAATTTAAAAYEQLGDFLARELAPVAPEQDACGRERYELLSRYFVGADVDLAETYEWGQQELAAITAQMHEVAERISPGASIEEAIAVLNTDPRYVLEGTDALRAWMQERADEAIASLADVHFDIPDPVRRIECRIAPTQTGGIYYTGPSEDFSRPGRMWWSVPKGETTFYTWCELTTVYHEGVPGHHLQVAQTAYRSALLNRWRRLAAWTSGHGEGWALYAERLMTELGFMDDPGNRLGWLGAQSLRAARVVIDIGVHCGFEAPAEVGGGAWTYDKAWAFLTGHSHESHRMLRFELDRYLGWPGQAPSYKIGERLWLELRDQVRARDGGSSSIMPVSLAVSVRLPARLPMTRPPTPTPMIQPMTPLRPWRQARPCTLAKPAPACARPRRPGMSPAPRSRRSSNTKATTSPTTRAATPSNATQVWLASKARALVVQATGETQATHPGTSGRESATARHRNRPPRAPMAKPAHPRAVSVNWAATAVMPTKAKAVAAQPATEATEPAGSMPSAAYPAAVSTHVDSTAAVATRTAATSGARRPTTPAPTSSNRPSSSSVRVCRRTRT